MKFILRYTPEPGTHHYFVSHDKDWPHRPGLKLIGPTTTKRENARRFDAHADALAALKLSDDPPGWLVDEVPV
jgi:hypothetical protein